MTANRTGSLMRAMVYHTQDPVVEHEIELFMMQLLHRKVTFTAFDFLPIDFTLLYSANRTGSLIHAIRCPIRDSVVDNEIEIFMMQLLHRKVTFTAFDFLPIDCTLLYSANRTGSLMPAMIELFMMQLLHRKVTFTAFDFLPIDFTLLYSANRTGSLIHAIRCPIQDSVVDNEIEMFMMQLLHRKVTFTALDFLPIDCTLLYSIELFMMQLLHRKVTFTAFDFLPIDFTLLYSANRTGSLIHAIRCPIQDSVVDNEIEMFMMQLLHRKVTFTAFDLLPIDCTLLYSRDRQGKEGLRLATWNLNRFRTAVDRVPSRQSVEGSAQSVVPVGEWRLELVLWCWSLCCSSSRVSVINSKIEEMFLLDGIAKKIDIPQKVIHHIRVPSLASTGINFDQDLREKIKLYRSIHDNLCDVCELVNQIFSIQLLLISAALFSDANRTGSLMPAMAYSNQDPVVKHEIELFMMQLLHRKVTFTAFDFIPIDFTLLYSFFGAVTTYLVILIQFHIMNNTKYDNIISSSIEEHGKSSILDPDFKQEDHPYRLSETA
uniref:Gustatory receptor n=1 Tax=Timema californicum TaxID=61474 RepID=A0A7R9P5C5_TIMCA|nr:unnamed protein product [Timema californicum]